MRRSTLLRFGWRYTKKYLLAVLTVAVIRTGLMIVLSDIAGPVTKLTTRAVNFIIQRGFPDHLLLHERYGPPWQYHVKMIAEGVAIIVIGMFFGLWADLRAERKQTS